MYDHIPRDLLNPALDAARAVLREMEEDEVPNKLRKVVAYSGGSLPPPLARSLGTALDGDADFRSSALEAWPEADLAAGGQLGASALFLIRPENWEFDLGKLVAQHDLGANSEAEERLRSDLERAEAEVAEGKERIASLRDELKDARKRAKRPRTKRKQPDESAELLRKVEDLEAAQAAAVTAQSELTGRAKRLESKLASARQGRADAVKQAKDSSGFSWSSADPVALARHLDDVASVVTTGSRVHEYFHETMGFQPGPWKLPPGARPDGRNSIEWLMRQGRPFVLAVDGHNLAHHVRPAAAAEPTTRDEIAHAMARFKLHTKTVVRVVLFFDSSISPDGDSYRGPAGVEIRFASSAATADHEILALVDTADDPVAVVSSDREVREGSERRGAIGLWSESMKEWMHGGGT